MPFEPATYRPAPLRLGLTGTGTTGKTYTALRLATGMARITPGPIGVIDTEGHASLYASKFSFLRLDIRAPFDHTKFVVAMSEAAKAKLSVLIFDTYSAHYVGPGGLLDRAKRDPKTAHGANWRLPSEDAAKLIALCDRAAFPGHIIFIFRAKLAWAKEEVGLLGGDGPTDEELKKGPHIWEPITKHGNGCLLFELPVHLLLNPEPVRQPNGTNRYVHGRPVINEFKFGRVAPPELEQYFPPARQLDERVGECLAHYAETGEFLPLTPTT